MRGLWAIVPTAIFIACAAAALAAITPYFLLSIYGFPQMDDFSMYATLKREGLAAR